MALDEKKMKYVKDIIEAVCLTIITITLIICCTYSMNHASDHHWNKSNIEVAQ